MRNQEKPMEPRKTCETKKNMWNQEKHVKPRKTYWTKKNLWNQEKPVKPRKTCETKKNKWNQEKPIEPRKTCEIKKNIWNQEKPAKYKRNNSVWVYFWVKCYCGQHKNIDFRRTSPATIKPIHIPFKYFPGKLNTAKDDSPYIRVNVVFFTGKSIPVGST